MDVTLSEARKELAENKNALHTKLLELGTLLKSALLEETQIRLTIDSINNSKQALIKLHDAVEDELTTEDEVEEHSLQSLDLSEKCFVAVMRAEKHLQSAAPAPTASTIPSTAQTTSSAVPAASLNTPKQTKNKKGGGDVHINRYHNTNAFRVIAPCGLNYVLKWGCRKSREQTFHDFLIINEKTHKQWLNKNKEMLKDTDGSRYNVTFLFELIPEVCEHFSPRGLDIKGDTDKGGVECLLKALAELKVLRNDIMHDLTKAAINGGNVKKIQNTLITMLREAGALYSISEEDIASSITEINGKFIHIRKLSDEDKTIIEVLKNLNKEGRTQMPQASKMQSNEYLPTSNNTIVNIRQVFHPISLTAVDEEQTVKQIKCKELLNIPNKLKELERFIIIEGAAGAGKSTLLKQMVQDGATTDSSLIFSGVRKFELILYIRCLHKTIDSFAEFVRKNGSIITEQRPEHIIEAIKHLKVLVLIDGIDELNENSEKLVWDVLTNSIVNERSSYVITSGSASSCNFKRQLDMKGVSYLTCTIQEIEGQEQIKFLEKYQAAIPDIEPPDLIEAFKSLKPELRAQFVTPMWLSLFCHLFRHHADQVDQWAGEHCALQATIQLCKKVLTDLLQKKKSVTKDNDAIVAEILLEYVCDMSLQCMHRNEMSVSQKAYEQFCQQAKAHDKPGVELFHNEILRCILPMQASIYTKQDNTFEYINTSHQEFLAALSLTRKFEQTDDSVMKVISSAVEESFESISNPEYMKKYVNVLKFVIIELGSGETMRPLKLHLPRLCEVLKTYAGADAQYWAQLLTEYRSHREDVDVVLQTVARVAAEDDEWRVNSGRHIAAYTSMLQHNQPLRLKVSLSSAEGTPHSLKKLALVAKERFKGELYLELHRSHDNYEPCDDLICSLSGASCCLGASTFRGCLSRSNAVQTLGALLKKSDTHLHISLLEPLQHRLQLLHLKPHRLSLTVNHTEVSHDQAKRPLPDGSHFPPELTVVDTPESGLQDVVTLIISLAPETKRYWRLVLRDCLLNNLELDQLIESLKSAGVHTTRSDSSISQWKCSGGNINEWASRVVELDVGQITATVENT